MAKRHGRLVAPPAREEDGDWVQVWVVRHHPDGRLIRRKDGKPFRFKVRPRKRKT